MNPTDEFKTIVEWAAQDGIKIMSVRTHVIRGKIRTVRRRVVGADGRLHWMHTATPEDWAAYRASCDPGLVAETAAARKANREPVLARAYALPGEVRLKGPRKPRELRAGDLCGWLHGYTFRVVRIDGVAPATGTCRFSWGEGKGERSTGRIADLFEHLETRAGEVDEVDDDEEDGS